MAIGINWADVWGPVWAPVWATAAPAPAPSPAPAPAPSPSPAPTPAPAPAFTATVTTRSQGLTRDQIAALVGPNNPRAIKVIENLLLDVSTTLPQAVDQIQLSALFSLHGADGSKQASSLATALVHELQTIILAMHRSAPDVNALRHEIELLRVELHDTRTHLLSAIQRAQRSADSALTLVSGV